MTLPTIFLDRDGVINHDRIGYVASMDEWEPIEGSLEAMAQLTQAGYPIFVITNQSGIGRGYYTLENLVAIHQRMLACVHQKGGKIVDIYYCPHAPEEHCSCRKPNPGMLVQCQREHGMDLTQAYFVGDRLTDLQVGDSVGAQAVLVTTGRGDKTLAALPKSHPYPVYANLSAFVKQMLT